MLPVFILNVSTLARRFAVISVVLFLCYNPTGLSGLHLLLDIGQPMVIRLTAGIFSLTALTVLARQAWLGWRLVGPHVTLMVILAIGLLIVEGSNWLALGSDASYLFNLLLLSILLTLGHLLGIGIRIFSGQTARLKTPP